MELDGELCGYEWATKAEARSGKESWQAQWVGYPLTKITDVEEAKALMLNKLLPVFLQLAGMSGD